MAAAVGEFAGVTTRLQSAKLNLYRGLAGATGVARAAAGSSMAEGTIFGHFTKFGVWYPVRSLIEGEFVERIAPGALRKTIAADRDRMRVQFDHGHDPYIGGKPLGPISVLREDSIGGYYEVPLLDTDYNHNVILPMLEGRLMNGTKVGSTVGASFRFAVVDDRWAQGTKSAHNPYGLPERTITEVELYEFGPVVFPASQAATAGARGLTDHYAAKAAQIASAGNVASPRAPLALPAGRSNPSAAIAKARLVLVSGENAAQSKARSAVETARRALR